MLSEKTLLIDHSVKMFSSGLPDLTARSYRATSDIGRLRYLFVRAFRVVYRDNGPLILEAHRDCRTIIQCNGSVF